MLGEQSTEVSGGGFALDINEIEDGIKTAAQLTQLAKTSGPGLLSLLKGLRTQKQDGVQDYQDVVRNLLRDNALDTVATLTLTTEAAFHILGPDFTTENVLDPTWEKRWIQGAANVAAEDEERRTWWSRLLAGEIRNPGTYSPRTLRIMDTLSPTEAQLFRTLSSCVWRDRNESPVLLMPNAYAGQTWGMTERQARTLAEAGLVTMPALGFQIQLTEGKVHRFQNGSLDILVRPNEDKLWYGTTAELTKSGIEILNLVEVNPDATYQQELIKELKKHAKVFHAVKVQGGWNAGSEVEIESNDTSQV